MGPYIGLLRKELSSDYGVSFPDFPGCVAAAKTLDEARELAIEALTLHIAGMKEDGAPLPAPSSLEEVMHHRENRDGVAILVEIPAAKTRAVRVNVTFDERILREIDKQVEALGLSRSAFLARAARHELDQTG